MKEVLDFLNKAQVYFLATTDGERPFVRPIGFAMEWQGKLAFCTGNHKPMYKQMKENPCVELCAFDPETQTTLRVTGKAKFVTTPESQQKALEVMPVLKNMDSVNDGRFEIFIIEGTAFTATMSGETQELAM